MSTHVVAPGDLAAEYHSDVDERQMEILKDLLVTVQHSFGVAVSRHCFNP